jgi:hypothetical protein
MSASSLAHLCFYRLRNAPTIFLLNQRLTYLQQHTYRNGRILEGLFRK